MQQFNLKENTMIDFGFEKYYKEVAKKTEEVAEQIKQANEFWVNSILASYKAFYATKK